MDLTSTQLALLDDLLRQPTAPFREVHVQRFIEQWLTSQDIPFFFDPIGNIVTGVDSEQAFRRLLGRREPEPVRLFVAHMDHPGFHGVRWRRDGRLQIQWHGGSPTKHVSGSRVWLATADGEFAHGRISEVALAKHGFSIDRAIVKVEEKLAKRPAAKAVFGGFGFRAPHWRAGARLYTRVADDLIGVFCILQTAQHLFRRHKSTTSRPFIGLLTRAEEVGFVGAIGHLELGWWRAKRDLLAVSLEASRTLPNAEIGKGPVVRLGDRRTVFDAYHLQWLTDLAERALKGNYQRRIMDGGACEATATTAYGIPTVGISIPLGNYHNQGLEGGQDCPKPNGPAPEFVHVEDIARMVKLCQAIATSPLVGKDPWRNVRTKLKANYRKSKPLLR